MNKSYMMDSNHHRIVLLEHSFLKFGFIESIVAKSSFWNLNRAYQLKTAIDRDSVSCQLFGSSVVKLHQQPPSQNIHTSELERFDLYWLWLLWNPKWVNSPSMIYTQREFFLMFTWTKAHRLIQIEWNTQTCKLLTNTRLIWWRKFPFSAISKVSNSPRIYIHERVNENFPIENGKLFLLDCGFSHRWITLHGAFRRVKEFSDSNQYQTKILRGCLDDPSSDKRGDWKYWLRQDMHIRNFAIKSAAFRLFSSCLSRNLVEFKSETLLWRSWKWIKVMP